MKKTLKYILLIVIFLSGINSCIVVKHPEHEDVTPTINISPKPELEMQDEPLRSKRGDMIAFLPEEWFLVDIQDKVSNEIFAVAVNPDYTLSAVFSNIRKTDQIDETFKKEGLLGLARISLSRRERKTAGTVKQIGKYSPLSIGTNSFVKYEISTTSGALSSKVAVFRSSLGLYYEFALVPMDFTRHPIPGGEEYDKIFRSIVSTIKF